MALTESFVNPVLDSSPTKEKAVTDAGGCSFGFILVQN